MQEGMGGIIWISHCGRLDQPQSSDSPAVVVIHLHRRSRLRREIILKGIKKVEEFLPPMPTLTIAKVKDMERARGLTAMFLNMV